jgi:uncharacterized membrane protein
MDKGRLEAFSDGVIAIIITIMVLELRPPHAETLDGLRPLLPALLSYILSFVYVGIYWNNHHHLFQAVKNVSGMTLWANLHLLFWLSLIPFVTNWMGDSHFATVPVVAYGGVLFMCAVSWAVLARQLVRHHGKDSVLAAAVGSARKERVSLALYVLGMLLASAGALAASEGEWLGICGAGVYAGVAIIWFIPDRRIERAIAKSGL